MEFGTVERKKTIGREKKEVENLVKKEYYNGMVRI